MCSVSLHPCLLLLAVWVQRLLVLFIVRRPVLPATSFLPAPASQWTCLPPPHHAVVTAIPPPPPPAPLLWLRPAPLRRDSALPHRPFFNTTVSSLPSFDRAPTANRPDPTSSLLSSYLPLLASFLYCHRAACAQCLRAISFACAFCPRRAAVPFAAAIQAHASVCFGSSGLGLQAPFTFNMSALPFCSCFVTSIRGMGSESHAYAKHRP